MNVRFWVLWNNSYAKITLRPGESVSMISGGPTEEGWASVSRIYRFCDRGLTLEKLTASAGRDCDGYAESARDFECPITEAHAGLISESYARGLGERLIRHNGELIHRPRWSETKSSQYDQTAERAGY